MRDELLIRDNESRYDHIKRIVCGKLVDKTIDEKFEDLSEPIFGEGNCFSESEVRKRMYGMRFLIEVLESIGLDCLTEDAIIKRIESEKVQLAEEKVKLRDQRREYNKSIREKARFDHIKDEFIKVFQNTDDIIPLDFKCREYQASEKEGVLLLGDWHVGLKVENYWNKYDIEIFHERINKLVNKTIEYGKLHNIRKLHIMGLGDFLHGIIHVNVRVANEEDVVTQIKIVAETLAKMLIEFCREFEEVEFSMTRGNHARIIPNKKESIDKENFEEFIIWYLEAKLSSLKNLILKKNEMDDEIIVTNILGYNCFGVHGDKDKINNVVENLSLMLRIIPDYVFTADKHHLEENEIHGVEVTINRSLSGVDQYAKSIRKTSKAGQTFMIFSKEEGRECTYNIKLN